MDFEKQIQTDRESLIQDIMKLVSIDSVEAAPDAGMPFGAGAAKALDCFLETAESIGLKTENFDLKILYLDSSDDVIVRRDKETRRKHPLDELSNGNIREAIAKERDILVPIKGHNSRLTA